MFKNRYLVATIWFFLTGYFLFLVNVQKPIDLSGRSSAGFPDVFGAEERPGPLPPSKKVRRAIDLAIGQWVKYEVKRYQKDKPASDPAAVSEGELKISIVDRVTLYEEELYWVEVLLNEGKEQQRVIKFLINKEGVPQAEKLILKYGNLQAVEINLRLWAVKTRVQRELLLEEMTHNLNVIPFTRVLNPADKIGEGSIAVNLVGKETVLDCTKVSIEEPKYNISGSVWYSDKVPLAGLVKFFFIEDKYRTMILLTGYDLLTGRSIIKEKPRLLNFREK